MSETCESNVLIGYWIDGALEDDEDFTNDTIVELSNNNEGESVRDE